MSDIEAIREDHKHECPMCHYGIGQFCAVHALLAEVDRLREALRPFATTHYRDVHPGRRAKDGGFFRPEDVELAQKAYAETGP